MLGVWWRRLWGFWHLLEGQRSWTCLLKCTKYYHICGHHACCTALNTLAPCIFNEVTEVYWLLCLICAERLRTLLACLIR